MCILKFNEGIHLNML